MSTASSKGSQPNRMLAISLDDYIRDFIDGYLAADITTMMEAQPNSDNIGAVGYPLVVTVSTGIEALSRLALPLTKKGRSRAVDIGISKKAFLSYWSLYLTPSNPSYADRGEAFYRKVRSGIVHYYLAKGELFVVKGGPEFHMTSDPNSGPVFVDAVQLARDYLASVNGWKRWLSQGLNRALAETNWTTIATTLGEERLLINLPASPLLGQDVSVAASGAVSTQFPALTGTSADEWGKR